MAGQAGYNYTISVSTAQSGTYYEIASQNGSFNRTADVLDDTDTTNAGYHTRLLGLLDSACTAEAHWSASDNALSAIESAYENRTALWVKILPDGQASNGKKFPVVVENYNMSLDVTGLVTLSASFQGNGAVIADDA
jgi:predicted secreted protein